MALAAQLMLLSAAGIDPEQFRFISSTSSCTEIEFLCGQICFVRCRDKVLQRDFIVGYALSMGEDAIMCIVLAYEVLQGETAVLLTPY
jgi:hypothetical protein